MSTESSLPASALIPNLEAVGAPQPLRPESEQLPFNGMVQVVAQAQSLFGPWRALSSAILGDPELSADLRQVAILRVAGLSVGSDYVEGQHVEIVRQLDVGGARIAEQAPRRGDGSIGDEEVEGSNPFSRFVSF
jgi:hypothetical protein